MNEVIKGSYPTTNIVIEGSVPINNRFSLLKDKSSESEEEKPREEKDETAEETDDNTVKVDYEELEALREQYRSEGEAYAKTLQARADAEYAQATEKATKLLEDVKEQERLMLEEMRQRAEAAVEEGRKQGAEAGYAEGVKKGEEEGYIQGLKKCKDTLLDLKKLCEDIEKEKAEILAENRRGIFDLALSVAEKITLTTFAQKDKRALEKMITSAAKEFRSTKSIRVSLSRLDLGEDVEADFRLLEKCFSPTVNVEFEAIDNAESGTILLESDSEILDTSVSTQLKMINELGRGKFREKDEDPYQDIEEEPELPKPKEKSRAKAKTKPKAEPASAVSETTADTDEEPTADAEEMINAIEETVGAFDADEGALPASLTEAAGADEMPAAASAEETANAVEASFAAEEAKAEDVVKPVSAEENIPETAENSAVVEQNTESLSNAVLKTENTDMPLLAETEEVLTEMGEVPTEMAEALPASDNAGAAEAGSAANTAENTALSEGGKEKASRKRTEKSAASQKNAEKANKDTADDEVITLTKSAVQQTLEEAAADTDTDSI